DEDGPGVRQVERDSEAWRLAWRVVRGDRPDAAADDKARRYGALVLTVGASLGPLHATLRALGLTLAGLSAAGWLGGGPGGGGGGGGGAGAGGRGRGWGGWPTPPARWAPPTSAAASQRRAPTTSWRTCGGPSTACSTACRRRSSGSGASPATPRTSCARR